MYLQITAGPCVKQRITSALLSYIGYVLVLSLRRCPWSSIIYITQEKCCFKGPKDEELSIKLSILNFANWLVCWESYCCDLTCIETVWLLNPVLYVNWGVGWKGAVHIFLPYLFWFIFSISYASLCSFFMQKLPLCGKKYYYNQT